MSQEHIGYPYDFAKEDPIEQFWAIHGRKTPVQPFLFDEMMQEEAPKVENDRWTNGANALAAIVLGLIFMVLVSIPVHASGAAKKHKGTRVQAIEQRETEPKKACLSPVRVVGSQWATEGGAEESAQKAWAEAVRFNHGEAFMSLETAIAYQKRCARSSIGEIAGQTLHRCEVDAIPCRPPFTAGAK